MNMVHKLLGRNSRPVVAQTTMLAESSDDLRAELHAELVKTTEDLGNLKEALRLMGFDPEKISQCVADPTDACLKAILLNSVGLDAERLKARAGANTNMAGWREMWQRLRAE